MVSFDGAHVVDDVTPSRIIIRNVEYKKKKTRPNSTMV